MSASSPKPRAEGTGGTRTPGKHPLLLALGLMVAVGLLLFARSFLPNWTLFSNDGPLGLIKAQESYRWSNMRSVWLDLNWIGSANIALLVNLSYWLYWLFGAVAYSKFYAPLSLLLLGFSASLFFQRLRLRPAAVVLGGLAAMLNSDPFSYACWGLASLPAGMACAFLALAALAGEDEPGVNPWFRAALAGFALGMSVVESYDNGAIFSLFVAAFVVFQAWNLPGSPARRAGVGGARLGIVIVCAIFMAAQALTVVLGTQVQGVVGMAQDPQTRARRWNEATQWSLPKAEALRIVVAGLVGYRMDTPNGGNYWGGVGRDPVWDAYLAQAQPDPAQAPRALLRHSGAGFYGGVFVSFMALWGIAQALRGRVGPFDEPERKAILFWAVAATISLLLAFGRHAPFYQFFYALPYASTIRNPIKFLHTFHLAWVVLFAYGLHGLWRAYVLRPVRTESTVAARLRAWWQGPASAEKSSVVAGAVVFGGAAVLALIYFSSRTDVIGYLARVGFPNPGIAAEMASASFREVGWSLLFLLLSVLWLALVVSRSWTGHLGRLATVTALALLLADLGRANQPWVIYYDYSKRYASNPVIDALRQTSTRHDSSSPRVTARLNPFSQMPLANDELFPAVYNEWLEHLFQFYRIHTLDIIQMPRVPALDAEFRDALYPTSAAQMHLVPRLWELTSTRYLLAMAGAEEALNRQFDPTQKRFRVRTPFALQAVPGVTTPSEPSDLTAVTNSTGPYAIIEFEGALPWVSLFGRWQVETNDAVALARLASPVHDPHDVVLIAGPVPPSGPDAAAMLGQPKLLYYEPKRLRLEAKAERPAVLLVNDRYHPDWRVTVDGRPSQVLRCNHIMRGVYLEQGTHLVEFSFEPSSRMLYVTLSAFLIAFTLLGIVWWSAVGRTEPTTPKAEDRPDPRLLRQRRQP